MKFTYEIEKIAEVTIASQYVKDEQNSRPVNVIFSTLSGGGKSDMLLEKFGYIPKVKPIGDITYDRLAKTYLDEIHTDRIRTLIFPEFNKILGRKASVARNTIGLLDEVSEEGVPSIDLPLFQRTWEPPVRCNILIGLAPNFIKSHVLEWWSFGFAQRFLFVTWNYSSVQIKQVMLHIIKQKHLEKEKYSKVFRERDIELSERFAKKLEPYSMKMCEDKTRYVEKICKSKGMTFDSDLESELPYRTQMRLQKFLKALALVNGRDEVKPFEFLEFQRLFRYMNLEFNELND